MKMATRANFLFFRSFGLKFGYDAIAGGCSQSGDAFLHLLLLSLHHFTIYSLLPFVLSSLLCLPLQTVVIQNGRFKASLSPDASHDEMIISFNICQTWSKIQSSDQIESDCAFGH